MPQRVGTIYRRCRIEQESDHMNLPQKIPDPSPI